MELKIFLRVLLKRWWIIILILIVTVIITMEFTYLQPPLYSSAATYVVLPMPKILDGTGYLSGLSVLGGQPTVANTYASIAESASIKKKSSDALGLSPASMKTLHVASRVKNGTNVIEITVEGPDPLLVQALCIKIGESTIDYITEFNGVYILTLLDAALAPEAPIKPNKKLNLALGIGMGMVLGIGLAFLLGLKEY
jgi:capsular polysaccharide biosynthesis protein